MSAVRNTTRTWLCPDGAKKMRFKSPVIMVRALEGGGGGGARRSNGHFASPLLFTGFYQPSLLAELQAAENEIRVI